MSRRIRSFFAALTTAALLGFGATPALAFQDEGLAANEKHVPVAIDAAVLRPLGLMLTATGAVLSVLPTAFVAITRPTEIHKPFLFFVGTPFRYTFMDPLGEHPPGGTSR